MLVVRNFPDSDRDQALPGGCSLCGRPSDDYLATPWDHIDICRLCTGLAYMFFKTVKEIEDECGTPLEIPDIEHAWTGPANTSGKQPPALNAWKSAFKPDPS